MTQRTRQPRQRDEELEGLSGGTAWQARAHGSAQGRQGSAPRDEDDGEALSESGWEGEGLKELTKSR